MSPSRSGEIWGVRRMVAFVVVLATAGCGGTKGTGPNNDTDPGFVRIEVVGPASPNVALKFRITGGTVDSVRNATGVLYFQTLGPALHRAIVRGTTDRTRLIEFWMPDRSVLETYGVNLEEVADAATYQNLSVAAYSVSISK